MKKLDPKLKKLLREILTVDEMTYKQLDTYSDSEGVNWSSSIDRINQHFYKDIGGNLIESYTGVFVNPALAAKLKLEEIK